MKTVLLFVTVVLLLPVISRAQWQADVRLTNNTANSWTSYNNAWCVAASGPVVHAIWYDYRNGNFEIYYKRSTNAGLSWGAETRLTNNSAASEMPSVTALGQVVHLVWEDQRDGNREIYYKRSTDGGVSWGSDIRMTNNPAESSGPSVSASGQIVHLLWKDFRDGNWEEYYKRSTDGGVSWGADTRLTNEAAESGLPTVSSSGLTVHVAWDEARDGNWEIYYKRSTDGGVSWGADVRMTNNIPESGWPSLSSSGSVAHIVWQDERDGNREIYYKRSTDGGASWGPDTRLTNNAADGELPVVCAYGSDVHVVFEDTRNGSDEIYYKHSADGGLTWGADVRVTNNSAVSEDPSVAVSGQVVHVVWEENRDGNWEIYYNRICKITATPPASKSVATGATATFSVTSTDTCLSYQWQQSTGGSFSNLSNTGAYSGVTTSTLRIQPVASSMNNYRYRCITSSCQYCTDTSLAATLNVGPTGIPGNSVHEVVSIFPNPFIDELVFQSSNAEQLELTILDISGRTLIRQSLIKTSKVNTISLSTGIYLYEIGNRSGIVQRGKLVKN